MADYTDILPAKAAVPATLSGAEGDDQAVALWLASGKAASTREAYAAEVRRFRNEVRKPLRAVTLRDILDYLDDHEGSAPATQARRVNALKGLFRFLVETGYLPFNPMKVVNAPRGRDRRNERVLEEDAVRRLVAAAEDARDRALILLAYTAGLRRMELAQLRWGMLRRRDLPGGGFAAQVTVLGKGGRSRTVLIPGYVWLELEALRRPEDGADDPVFRSRKKGGPLTATAIWRVIKRVAAMADLPEAALVSPHWLRHSFASHTLDHGVPVHALQQALGHKSLQTTGQYLHARPNDGPGLYLPRLDGGAPRTEEDG